MAYATPAQMIQRYDANRLGELVKDDGTKATSVQLLTDTVLLAILADAQQEVDTALTAGGRYTKTELAALITANTNANPLIRLTCDIAYGLLVARRGYTEEEVGRLAPRYKAAMQQIELLRDGMRLFQVDGKADVMKPHRVVLSEDVYLITSADRVFGTLSDGTGV